MTTHRYAPLTESCINMLKDGNYKTIISVMKNQSTYSEDTFFSEESPYKINDILHISKWTDSTVDTFNLRITKIECSQIRDIAPENIPSFYPDKSLISVLQTNQHVNIGEIVPDVDLNTWVWIYTIERINPSELVRGIKHGTSVMCVSNEFDVIEYGNMYKVNTVALSCDGTYSLELEGHEEKFYDVSYFEKINIPLLVSNQYLYDNIQASFNSKKGLNSEYAIYMLEEMEKMQSILNKISMSSDFINEILEDIKKI